MKTVAFERTRHKARLVVFNEIDANMLRKARDQINSKTSRLYLIPTILVKQNWENIDPFLIDTYNTFCRTKTYNDALNVARCHHF